MAWDHLEADAALKDLMGRAAAPFGTLARCGPTRGSYPRRPDATRPDCLVVYDVNLRQQWYERSWIEQSLSRSKIVKLNGDEAVVLADLLETGAGDHVAFARAIQRRYGVDTVCITRAEQGCLLVAGEEVVDPGVQVDVVDAVGAGDAHGRLIVSRLRPAGGPGYVRQSGRRPGGFPARPPAVLETEA